MINWLGSFLRGISSGTSNEILSNIYQKSDESSERQKQNGLSSFAVKMPKGLVKLGILYTVVFWTITVIGIITTWGLPPFAICFFGGIVGSFGVIIIFYATYSKVEVKGDTIRARIFLKRTVITTFADIKSVYRRVECRNVSIENLIITTKDGKQFIVKRGGKGYKRFLKRIYKEVPPDRISECWS